MKDTKLVRYLQTLTKEEVKALTTFIKKEITNITLISLYERIIPYHPDFEALDEKLLLKEVVDKKGNHLTLKQLQTNLSKLCPSIEQFFVQQYLPTRPELQGYLIASALAKRGLFEDYKKNAQDQIEKLEHETISDPFHLHILSELCSDLFFHPYTEKYQTEAVLLDKAHLYLDKSYLLSKLRLLTESAIRKKIHHTEYFSFNWDHINFILSTYNEPVFRIYANLIQILQLDSPDPLLNTTKIDLEKNIHLLNHEDKSNITTKLIQCANYFYDAGNPEYLNYAFELYKLADRHNFILYNDSMLHTLFINIVATASGVNKFGWVNSFITKYKNKLNPLFVDSTLALTEIIPKFFDGKYKEIKAAIPSLQKKHPTIYLQTETLYLRVCYELIIADQEDQEDFDLCTQRLQQYIYRGGGDLSEERILALNNFIKCLNNMVKFYYTKKYPNQEDDIPAMKTALLHNFKNLSPIFSRGWVHEKMMQL